MLERLRKKAQKLVWLEFISHDRYPEINLDISPEELELELAKIPTPLFLGRYTEEEIRAKLERHKILPELRSRGFDPLILGVHTDGLMEHRIVIHTGEPKYDKILVELRLREGIFRVKESISKVNARLVQLISQETVPMLWIDWLLLQNPYAKFTPSRPPLPEQKYPGLGILNLVVPLIGELAAESHKQAVLDIPEHLHGALFYSRWMKFFNPEMEGRLKAIMRDLKNYSLAIISWANQLGAIFNSKTEKYEEWKPGEQIYPLNRALEQYFNSPLYNELSQKAFEENSYQLDLALLKEKMKKLDPEEQKAVEFALGALENGGD